MSHKAKKASWLYMLVSKDEYELPIAVFDSVHELSEYTGASENTIRSTICKFEKGILKSSRFRRVKGEERLKEICKNCIHCKPSYRSYYCDKNTKNKKTKLQGTCEDWTPKR